MQFCQKSMESPCMPDEFLREVLRLNPDVQCYTGEKFEETSYFHHPLFQEADTKVSTCPQSQAKEKQKLQNLLHLNI